ncbi:MAG: dienelactone hydrolase family protein [Acidimicrobiales bacterium]
MRVELPSGTAAELAVPDQLAGRGVVVIPDIGGMRPLFDDLAAGLARQHGWAVGVFEPFPGQELPTIEARFAAVAALTDDRLLGDARATADRLGTERVAVIGFCMGGMYAYKAAGTGRFDRAVSFYGMIRVPADWRGPGHGEPLEFLAAPEACPVLSIIGGKDPYTPPDDVAALDTRTNVTPVVYPDAEHGFVHDASRPSHRADDAADAWRRVVEFLA